MTTKTAQQILDDMVAYTFKGKKPGRKIEVVNKTLYGDENIMIVRDLDGKLKSQNIAECPF